MRGPEAPRDPNDDKEGGNRPPQAEGTTTEIEEGEEVPSALTPLHSEMPSPGVAPPLSQAGTDDSVEIILS